MSAISELTTSLDIIAGLSDKPIATDGLTSAQLKAKFDDAGKLIKAYINATLVPAVNALDGNEHTHANKTLLDTYAQTEANLSDAVAKKHSHANTDVLAQLTQAMLDNAHTHTNKALLDTYTQTEANIADAVAKKHAHAAGELLDSTAAQTIAGGKTFSGSVSLGDVLILGAGCYGDTLPAAGTAGRLFFKKA